MVEGWFCLKMTLSIWDFTTAARSLMNFLIQKHYTNSQWTRLTDDSGRGVIRMSICDWRRLSEQRLEAVHWLSGSVPLPRLCQTKLTSCTFFFFTGMKVNGEIYYPWWTLRLTFNLPYKSCITIVMCVCNVYQINLIKLINY